MSKETAKKASAAQLEPEPPVWASWLTQSAFVLTMILLVARAALMSESLRDTFEVLGKTAAAGPSAPGPTTSLVMDALCCVSALLVLLRRVVDRQYVLRWTWSHVLIALLAIWAAMSVAWSTDKFATAVAAAHMVAAAALIWSTAQLVRSWLRLRIVAGVCLGLLIAYSMQGLIYRFVEVPENVRFWRENKEKILHDNGWEEDSFHARAFERKLLGGEMMGFNQSPNSYAAVIVLLLAVSAGLAIQRRASGDAVGWTIVIALACLPSFCIISLTHSRTAIGTITLAGLSFALLRVGRLRDWLTGHAKLAYAAVLGLTLLGAAALIGHGIYHGSLPNDSLNFRWRYWVASARLVQQHPLAGVGWGNFGPHYLAVRLPAAAEEVRDPHNFIVRAFAELGWIGGVIVLAWLARAGWELTRPVVPASVTVGPEKRRPAEAGPPVVARPSVAQSFAIILSIAAGGVIVNALASVDFSQQSAYVVLEVFRRVMWLGLLIVGLALATVRSLKDQAMDDRPAPWVLYGLLIGLGAFLVHAMMDFVLMEPGALTLFAVLLGAAIGVRTPSAAGAKKRRGVAIAALTIGAIAWVIAVLALVIPVADAEEQARRGDAAQRREEFSLAKGLLQSAARTMPLNADYAYRAATAAMRAGDPPEQIKALLGLAIAGDRAIVTYYLTRAGFELHLPNADPAVVRADYEKALALDPNNIPARLDYARTLETLGDRPAAAEQYRKALQTNEGYDATEPKRLPPAEVARIEETIRTLNK